MRVTKVLYTWGKIIKMRIDEGKIIIKKMLDKLRAQFRMKENAPCYLCKYYTYVLMFCVYTYGKTPGFAWKI